MQIKNKSATKAYTVNWSNGETSELAVEGVAIVPSTVSEAEVDRYILAVKDVVKVGGSELTGEDMFALYTASEGDDVLYTLSPAEVTQVIANSQTTETRDVEVMVTNTDGTLVSAFNDEVTVTLSTDSAAGSVAFVAQSDLTEGNSSLTGALYLRNGYGKLTITGSGLVHGETTTLTVAQKTFFGVTMTAKTSVATISAS